MDSKLNNGDFALIARHFSITPQSVWLLAEGKRGKRGSEKQMRIMEAIRLRERQNEQLDNYCRSLQVDAVVPEPLH